MNSIVATFVVYCEANVAIGPIFERARQHDIYLAERENSLGGDTMLLLRTWSRVEKLPTTNLMMLIGWHSNLRFDGGLSPGDSITCVGATFS